MEYRRLAYPYDGYKIYEDGSVWSDKTNRWIKTDRINSGYLTVNLWGNNRGKSWLVHRLVATLYLENPNNYPYVNHIDSNRDNNHVSNLEWCTPTENTLHARALGRYNDRIPVICTNVDTSDTVYCLSMTEACTVTGAKLESLSRIINGKRDSCVNGWHVSKPPIGVF